MNYKFILCVFCLFSSYLMAEESPTERYVSQHTMTDIKYNLRLENVTLDHKPIFDKAISQETAGFVGYYAASGKFRVYQDLIRLIFEEILDCPIREDFHFLAVPLYPQRTIKTLEEISQAFFYQKAHPQKVIEQFIPMHLSLYGNHNQIGFCPAKDFSLAAEPTHLADLYWFFETLEIDPALIEEAMEIGQNYFGVDHRILVQLFDPSYELMDQNSYPASPNGFPYVNQAVSDYLLKSTLGFPPQIYLLLHENGLLNPASTLAIKRYAKIQPTKLKNYEQELRILIKAASYNHLEKDLYKEQLMQAWEIS